MCVMLAEQSRPTTYNTNANANAKVKQKVTRIGLVIVQLLPHCPQIHHCALPWRSIGYLPGQQIALNQCQKSHKPVKIKTDDRKCFPVGKSPRGFPPNPQKPAQFLLLPVSTQLRKATSQSTQVPLTAALVSVTGRSGVCGWSVLFLLPVPRPALNNSVSNDSLAMYRQCKASWPYLQNNNDSQHYITWLFWIVYPWLYGRVVSCINQYVKISKCWTPEIYSNNELFTKMKWNNLPLNHQDKLKLWYCHNYDCFLYMLKRRAERLPQKWSWQKILQGNSTQFTTYGFVM